MFRKFPFRSLLIFSVWTLSAAAALWLTASPSRSTPVPAQVVAQEFRLAAVETGRLSTILAAPGQRVTGGQVIARLDTSVLEREIVVAEARLRQFAAETDASEAALVSDGYETERSFQADAEEAGAQLVAARAAQAADISERRQLREELERQRGYLQEGLVRRDRVDELELRLKTLDDAVLRWPERIEALVSRQRAAVERLARWRTQYSANSAPASREVRVQPLRDRIEEQIETLRVLRARLENSKVVTPADALVVSVLARPGDVVRAGEPFVLLNGAGLRQVLAYVPERHGKFLRAGTEAVLRRRTPQREEFHSRVVRVSDTVAPLPARFWLLPQLASWGREVEVEIPPGAVLDPGEALDVSFLAGDRS